MTTTDWADLDGGAERLAADTVYLGTLDAANGWIADAIDVDRADIITPLRSAAIVLGGLRALQLEVRAAAADLAPMLERLTTPRKEPGE